MRKLLLFLLMLLCPAIALSQSVGNGICTSATGTSFTATFPSNTTSGSSFVVWFVFPIGSTNTLLTTSFPVSDNNSNTYYNIGQSIDHVNSGFFGNAFYAFNTTNSPNAAATITVKTNNSVTAHLCIAEVTGVVSLYPLDKFGSSYIGLSTSTPSNMGTAGSQNGTPTPTTRDSHEIVVGFGYTAGNISVGTGFTCVAGNGTGGSGCTNGTGNYMIDFKTVTTTGSQQANFSSGTANDTGMFYTLTFRETGSTIANGFYWVQGNGTNDLTNALTATVNLAVTTGSESGNHLVVISWWVFFSAGSCSAVTSIADENSNTYSTTGMGTSTCNAGVLVGQASLLKAPANGGKNITITWANTNGNYTDAFVMADDFYYTAGTVTVDAHAGGAPNIFCSSSGSAPFSCTGTTVSVPTSGDLVYETYIVPDNGAILPTPYPGESGSGSWIGTSVPGTFTGVLTGLNNGEWASGGQFLYNSPASSQGATWFDSLSGDDFEDAITAFKFVASGAHAIPGKAIIF